MQDLQRAKAFCAEKLNLEPSEERSGGLLYRCGDGEFALFESASAASGDHTQRFRIARATSSELANR